MSYSKNEVVLLPIPFTDLSNRKVRPAVVIGLSRHPGDLFVAPITSQLPNASVPLQDWKPAGLNVPCGIKSQIATIEDRLVIKSVGILSARGSGCPGFRPARLAQTVADCSRMLHRAG